MPLTHCAELGFTPGNPENVWVLATCSVSTLRGQAQARPAGTCVASLGDVRLPAGNRAPLCSQHWGDGGRRMAGSRPTWATQRGPVSKHECRGLGAWLSDRQPGLSPQHVHAGWGAGGQTSCKDATAQGPAKAQDGGSGLDPLVRRCWRAPWTARLRGAHLRPQHPKGSSSRPAWASGEALLQTAMERAGVWLSADAASQVPGPGLRPQHRESKRNKRGFS